MVSAEHAEAEQSVRQLLEVIGPSPSPTTRRQAWDVRYGDLPLALGVTCERAPVPDVVAEWLAGPDPSTAVVQYHHGGGYSGGSLNTHRRFASCLAAASNGRVLNIGYRLAPEHPFPAAIEDALATYRWLLAQGIESASVVIGGDSAGGGLAAGVVHAIRDAGLPRPAALVLLGPWVDLVARDEGATDMFVRRDGASSMAEMYVGDHDPADPRISPVRGDLAGFPPVYVQVSASEALYQDAVGFADALRTAGVDVEVDAPADVMHTWPILAPRAPEAAQAIERLGRFVRRVAGHTDNRSGRT
jgi:acetyl esterase/lipase